MRNSQALVLRSERTDYVLFRRHKDYVRFLFAVNREIDLFFCGFGGAVRKAVQPAMRVPATTWKVAVNLVSATC
jgi:hypothetical protein